MSAEVFHIVVLAWIGLAIVIFPITLKITAPYGRHTSSKWGPMIDNRLGWILMEAPTLVCFWLFFFTGDATIDTVKWVLFSVWSLHYVYRIFIYPMRTKTKRKKMPLLIMLFAFFFNFMNGSLNGYWLGHLSPAYPVGWLLSPIFIIGAILFVTGYIINQDSDRRLLKLRTKSINGYSIPYGGLFKYVSCPNFYGEIIEWTGFALMAWNLPALSFAVWTYVNLIPRGLDHHRWYKSHFDDYPKNRKAIFPFVL